MYKVVAFFLIFIAILSCNVQPEGNPERFKYGTFTMDPVDNYTNILIVRKDSLQIEHYTKKISISTDSTITEKEIQKIDTAYITWKNNFAYTLKIKNPKTEIDKDHIFVQINKVTDSSCSFTARIGYSKYQNKGTMYIAK